VFTTLPVSTFYICSSSLLIPIRDGRSVMLLDTSPNFLNYCADLFVASKRVGGNKKDVVPARECLNIDRLTSFVITSQIPSQAMTRNSQS
jgi:hypothetical protein